MTKPAVPLLVLLLSACGTTIDAPSLLPRAAEREDIDTPVPPAPPPVADPAQGALIARARDLARQGEAAFVKALPAASVNAPTGSDAWIAAQNARSAVEVARAPTLDALALLDKAIADAVDKGQEASALTAARADIQAIYDRQTARLDAFIR